jgi:Tfp pilus assembly protein PilF
LLALRGAVSCLYLIKGRLLKDKHFLSKAIEYSTNNIDALLLLVMLEVRDGNYDKAKILIEAAHSLKEN